MQTTSCEMTGWMNRKVESRLLGELSITSDMQTCYLYGRKWRGTKEPLDEGEKGEWKSWLKTQRSKNKIMASSPITSWQIDRKTIETVTDFIFLGSKITADSDCSRKMKRRLLLGRKALTNLDGILKSRGITLLTKVHIVKAVAFAIVTQMWKLDNKEGWAPKKWCFWIVVLEKTWESLGQQRDQTSQS